MRLLKRYAALSRTLSKTYTLTKPHVVSRAACSNGMRHYRARLSKNYTLMSKNYTLIMIMQIR